VSRLISYDLTYANIESSPVWDSSCIVNEIESYILMKSSIYSSISMRIFTTRISGVLHQQLALVQETNIELTPVLDISCILNEAYANIRERAIGYLGTKANYTKYSSNYHVF